MPARSIRSSSTRLKDVQLGTLSPVSSSQLRHLPLAQAASTCSSTASSSAEVWPPVPCWLSTTGSHCPIPLNQRCQQQLKIPPSCNSPKSRRALARRLSPACHVALPPIPTPPLICL